MYFDQELYFDQNKKVYKSSMIQLAASFIKNSEFIIITAGAGIGRDSGLPDFRGNQGFWRNYPPYKGKFNFIDCANPYFLQQHPDLFWGFYGSRLEMYRKTIPHKGFQILLNLQKKLKKQIFVVTSNVDGQFQKVGFKQNQIYQIHGSLHQLQCDGCYEIKVNNFNPNVNYQTMSCQNLPKCQKCSTIMRPNVLLFNDYDWISQRSQSQSKLYKSFVSRLQQPTKQLCIIQIGAGPTIPSIRNIGDRLFYNKSSKFIRINPDPEQNSYTNQKKFIHLQKGSLEGLTEISKYLQIE